MSTVSYEPIGTMITVKLPELKEQTAGGIVKSDKMMQAERDAFTGAVKVRHTGPRVEPATGILPGDTVLLSNRSMLQEISIGKEKLHQTDANTILGILNKKR